MTGVKVNKLRAHGHRQQDRGKQPSKEPVRGRQRPSTARAIRNFRTVHFQASGHWTAGPCAVAEGDALAGTFLAARPTDIALRCRPGIQAGPVGVLVVRPCAVVVAHHLQTSPRSSGMAHVVVKIVVLAGPRARSSRVDRANHRARLLASTERGRRRTRGIALAGTFRERVCHILNNRGGVASRKQHAAEKRGSGQDVHRHRKEE
jgi:hypothetical protein